ncbi:MAG: hypothetical protein AB1Z98_28025 [Nannocystaceae bacterium]
MNAPKPSTVDHGPLIQSERMGSPWLAADPIGVGLSLDGRALVVSHPTHGLVVVDGREHTRRRTLEPAGSPPSAVRAVSPDGRWALTETETDAGVLGRVWDLDAGTAVATVEQRCIDVAAASSRVVCIPAEGPALEIALPSGRGAELPPPPRSPTEVAISPAGQLLAWVVPTAEGSDTVELWQDGRRQLRVDVGSLTDSTERQLVQALALSDDQALAILLADGRVVGLDGKTVAKRFEDPGTGPELEVVAIDPSDGSTWVQRGGALRRIAADGRLRDIGSHVEALHGLAFVDDAVQVVESRQLRRFGKDTGAERPQPGLSVGDVGRIVPSEDGRLVRAYDETRARVTTWDFERGAAVSIDHPTDCRARAPARGPLAAEFEAAWASSPSLVRQACDSMASVGIDGWLETLAISEDRFVRLAEGGPSTIHATADGSVLRQLDWFGVRPTIDATPDGRALVLAGYEAGLQIFDADSGQRLRTVVEPPASFSRVRVDRSGEWIVATDEDSERIAIYALVDGTRRWHAVVTGLGAFAVSEGGDELAVAVSGGAIERRSIPDGSLRQRLVGHDGPVKAVAYVRGGGLVSSSRDGTLIRWRPR